MWDFSITLSKSNLRIPLSSISFFIVKTNYLIVNTLKELEMLLFLCEIIITLLWCSVLPKAISLQFFPGCSEGKESICNAGDQGAIPGWGRSPGGRHGNPLQYSCIENSVDRGAWWATVHGVPKSQTWLKQLTQTRYLAASI